MDKKQDIGAAFKQRLQDLKQGPSDSAALWDQITTQLDAEATQPKGMPLWLKSGLAVLVVGVVSYGIWQFTAGPSSAGESVELTETTTEALNSDGQKVTNKADGNKPNGQQNTVMAVESDKLDTSNETTQSDNTIAAEKAAITDSEEVTDNTANTLATESNAISTAKTATAPTNQASGLSETKPVASQNNSATNNKDQITTEAKTKVAAAAEAETAVFVANKSATPTSVSTGNTSKTVPQQKGQKNNTEATTTVAQNTASSSATGVNNDPNLPARGYYVWPKSSVKDAAISTASYPLVYDIDAAEKAKALPVIEYRSSKKKKSKEARALERALRREEAINYKWSVGAVVAPTTYGSLSKGSMLDARLENNPREGETNLSYGVQIKNKMTEKSALRFGINRVRLGYGTQNFQVNIIDNVVNIYQLTGIDPGAEITQGGVALNPEATAFFEANDVVTIDQDISYLEIPVEYQYAFINNRFGANLIGGASLMVLDDNRIFALSDSGESIPVGKSSNLTNLGYTLNVGLGLKYDISKHFQLNLDPMLKVQMNSPENTSTNNFRPYYFGVFSGIHFKF